MLNKFHRIPIWEYRTDRQLLKGLLDALAAHKALCDEGILHGRISPETVFLVETVTEHDSAGFLDTTHAEEVFKGPSDHGCVPSGLAGTMPVDTSEPTNDTGALRFMSRRLLWHLSEGYASIQSGVADDVESFWWVLLYAVLRKLVANMVGTGRTQQRIRTAFCKIFSGTSAEDILDGRAAGLATIRRHRLFRKGKLSRDHISLPLRALLRRYVVYIRDTDEGHGVSEDSEDGGDSDDGSGAGRDAEAIAKVFNHLSLMKSLEDATSAGKSTNEMSVGD